MVKKSLAAAAIALLLFAQSAAAALRYSSWDLPFNVPMMIAAEEGSLARFEGVPVRTGQMMLASLASGELDLAVGVGDAAFAAAFSSGLKAKIVAIASRSPSTFAVVARAPEILSVCDLKGKKVGGLRASVVHTVLLKVLSEHGMSADSVELFSMPPAEAYAALARGDVDAALLVGADIMRAARDLGARVLADGTGRVGGISLIVASDRAIAERSQEIDQFLEVRARIVRAMDEDPDTALDAAARRTGLDRETAARLMEAYDFSPSITDRDLASIAETYEHLAANGLAEASADIRAMTGTH